jgi:hypothetical protein
VRCFTATMRERLARRGHSFVFPIVVWAGAAVCVAGVAAASGYMPWESSTWFRWDSGLYLDIARDGYDLGPCDDPTLWCGDAAWLPAYPWVVGALHLLGFPLQGTAAVISWLFAGATIVLLWATFFERRVDRAAAGALVYAAFAPGQIYHYAIFPQSLLVFCSVAFMWLLYRGRVLAAGIAGAVATLAYPQGLLLAPVAALWLLLQRQLPLGERLRRIAISCGLIVVGVWILILDFQLETGHWDAFFLVHDAYAHKWQSPFTGLSYLVRAGFPLSAGQDTAVAAQTAFVTLVLVIVVLDAIRRKVSLQSADFLVVMWAIATWALPLSQTVVGPYRGHAALLPLAILVARLPATLAWAFAVGAILIAGWIEFYFLEGHLV